jgi:hypothetical protein
MLYNKKYPKIAEIILILSVILVIFIIFMPNNNILNRLSENSKILTLILLSVGFLITAINLKMQLTDREKSYGVQYSTLTQNKIIEIDKMFMSNRNLDNLYLSMYGDDPTIKILKNIKDNWNDKGNNDNDYDILKAEHHMSNIIFQTIADVYICENFSSFDDTHEWIFTFKQWLKSPILRKHWKYLKNEHHLEVQQFINKLMI